MVGEDNTLAVPPMEADAADGNSGNHIDAFADMRQTGTDKSTEKQAGKIHGYNSGNTTDGHYLYSDRRWGISIQEENAFGDDFGPAIRSDC